ncbi:MAG TPA: HK97 family phage prohead protease [Nonomuraea sp.]|nr:HK97 family phage prohead protease [Nonomuraea sp.]
MLRTKSAPLKIKAAGEHENTEEGVFEAIVAAYNVDSVGDKIVPGAFKETLDEWKEKDSPIPVIWSHDWGDPDSHIGVVEEAAETDDGLWIKARLDLDEPRAAKVYKLLKGRRITQFSFGYEVQEGAFVDSKDADDGGGESYYELRKLKLFEVGPTLVGANQSTSLESVKSGVTEERVREIVAEARTKAEGDAVEDEESDEVAPLTDEEIRAVRALLADRADTDEDDSQDEKASPAATAADDEPAGAKSDAPSRSGSASLAAAQLQLMELSITEETA